MREYQVYLNNVYEYWTFLSEEKKVHLSIYEAKEMLKQCKEKYIGQMKNKRGLYCSNFMVQDVDTKEILTSNLFIVRDMDNPYMCECGEGEFYCIYLPEGIKQVDKDSSIIQPAYEGISDDIEYMITNYQIIPGIMIEINPDYTMKQDYTILCPICGKEGHFEYNENAGLTISWDK